MNTATNLRDLWLNGKTATIRAQAFRDMERARKAERVRQTDTHRAFLERSIDRAGLLLTLRMISEICEAKAATAPEGENLRWAVASDAIREAAREAE